MLSDKLLGVRRQRWKSERWSHTHTAAGIAALCWLKERVRRESVCLYTDVSSELSRLIFNSLFACVGYRRPCCRHAKTTAVCALQSTLPELNSTAHSVCKCCGVHHDLGCSVWTSILYLRHGAICSSYIHHWPSSRTAYTLPPTSEVQTVSLQEHLTSQRPPEDFLEFQKLTFTDISQVYVPSRNVDSQNNWNCYFEKCIIGAHRKYWKSTLKETVKCICVNIDIRWFGV